MNTADRTWQAFTSAQSAVLQKVKSDLDSCTQLTLGEIEVLDQLLRDEQGIRMAELADRVLTSRSGLTRRLDRLQRRGLAERTSVADDGRGASARLTLAGEEVARSVIPLYRASIARHFTNRLGVHHECFLAALDIILDR